jgi:hypothetical protein
MVADTDTLFARLFMSNRTNRVVVDTSARKLLFESTALITAPMFE